MANVPVQGLDSTAVLRPFPCTCPPCIYFRSKEDVPFFWVLSMRSGYMDAIRGIKNRDHSACHSKDDRTIKPNQYITTLRYVVKTTLEEPDATRPVRRPCKNTEVFLVNAYEANRTYLHILGSGVNLPPFHKLSTAYPTDEPDVDRKLLDVLIQTSWDYFEVAAKEILQEHADSQMRKLRVCMAITTVFDDKLRTDMRNKMVDFVKSEILLAIPPQRHSWDVYVKGVEAMAQNQVSAVFNTMLLINTEAVANNMLQSQADTIIELVRKVYVNLEVDEHTDALIAIEQKLCDQIDVSTSFVVDKRVSDTLVKQIVNTRVFECICSIALGYAMIELEDLLPEYGPKLFPRILTLVRLRDYDGCIKLRDGNLSGGFSGLDFTGMPEEVKPRAREMWADKLLVYIQTHYKRLLKEQRKDNKAKKKPIDAQTPTVKDDTVRIMRQEELEKLEEAKQREQKIQEKIKMDMEAVKLAKQQRRQATKHMHARPVEPQFKLQTSTSTVVTIHSHVEKKEVDEKKQVDQSKPMKAQLVHVLLPDSKLVPLVKVKGVVSAPGGPFK